MLVHGQRVIIPQARNHFFRVHHSEKETFLFACAAVISADGRGMDEWKKAPELEIGDMLQIGTRWYSLELDSDRYNVTLVPESTP